MSNKQKRQLAAKAAAPRQPIPMDLNTALGTLLNLAAQTDAVKVALSVICDERKLKGRWAIQITGAKMIPVPDKPAPPEGT